MANRYSVLAGCALGYFMLSAGVAQAQTCKLEGFHPSTATYLPRYIISNESTSFTNKGPYSWRGLSAYFYTSEDGYLGAKTYFNVGTSYSLVQAGINFNTTHGQGWTYIDRPDGSFACQDVIVQTRPTITGSYRSTARVNWTVSSNSAAVRENLGSTLTIYAKTEKGGGAETVAGQKKVTGTSGFAEFTPTNYRIDQGTVTFSGVINDGVYGKRIVLGTYTKGCPSNTSFSHTISPEWGPAPSEPCGRDGNNNLCPYTSTNKSDGQYTTTTYYCK